MDKAGVSPSMKVCIGLVSYTEQFPEDFKPAWKIELFSQSFSFFPVENVRCRLHIGVKLLVHFGRCLASRLLRWVVFLCCCCR